MVHARGLSGAGSAMIGCSMFTISAASTALTGLASRWRPEVSMGLVSTGLFLAAAVFAAGSRARA